MKSFIKFFLLLLLTGYVLNAAAAVGASCGDDGCTDANAACTGEENAKTCTCKTNYEAEGTKCVLSLGKSCTDEDTCVANAECTGEENAKTCTCKTNYTAKNNKCESNTDTNTNTNTNTNNDTSGSSFLKVFVFSFLSLLF